MQPAGALVKSYLKLNPPENWLLMDGSTMYVSNIPDCDAEVRDTLSSKYGGADWGAIQRTMPSSANWYSVTYGNGKFVAVAYNSSTAAYSTDGITWTAATMPSSANWYSLTYGNGKFVAVAINSNKAAYSTDGITWTAATMPLSANWKSVTYGNGKYVAVSNNNVAASLGANNDLVVLPSIPNTYVKLKD